MKYEFTGKRKTLENGVVVRQIRCKTYLKGEIAPGDLGGWIEKEVNLSHKGE